MHFFLKPEALINQCLKLTSGLTRPMEYFLATGNIVSPTGLGLMQVNSTKYSFHHNLSQSL